MNFLLLLAEGNAHGIQKLLDPHHGLIFWTACSFALTAIVLYKFAWGPILTALTDREAAIVGAIEEAQATKVEAEDTKARYEAQLENIRQDAQSIIDEGNADKARIISAAHAQATKEAAEIRARAEREIDLAKVKALAEVKDHARTLGIAIAEKVIVAEVDAAKHASIVDAVIANYGKV